MSDTPTPAPALTDEQIERVIAAFERTVGGKSVALRDADGEWMPRAIRFNTIIAAVIARAKREERERIGADLREWSDAVIGETGMRSDGATLRWAVERIEGE